MPYEMMESFSKALGTSGVVVVNNWIEQVNLMSLKVISTS